MEQLLLDRESVADRHPKVLFVVDVPQIVAFVGPNVRPCSIDRKAPLCNRGGYGRPGTGDGDTQSMPCNVPFRPLHRHRPLS